MNLSDICTLSAADNSEGCLKIIANTLHFEMKLKLRRLSLSISLLWA